LVGGVIADGRVTPEMKEELLLPVVEPMPADKANEGVRERVTVGTW